MYHVTGTDGIAGYDVFFDRELKSMSLDMCNA